MACLVQPDQLGCRDQVSQRLGQGRWCDLVLAPAHHQHRLGEGSQHRPVIGSGHDGAGLPNGNGGTDVVHHASHAVNPVRVGQAVGVQAESNDGLHRAGKVALQCANGFFAQREGVGGFDGGRRVDQRQGLNPMAVPGQQLDGHIAAHGEAADGQAGFSRQVSHQGPCISGHGRD